MSIVNYENDLREGDATYYDTLSNKKMVEGHFHEDKKDGTLSGYYSNRNKQFLIHYKEGKLDGDAIAYYKNGIMQRKEHYVNGETAGGECYNEKGEMIPYFPIPLPENNNSR
jgi:antitoxin component YwqK of YwqJK toxin-antitoxin module